MGAEVQVQVVLVDDPSLKTWTALVMEGERSEVGVVEEALVEAVKTISWPVERLVPAKAAREAEMVVLAAEAKMVHEVQTLISL